MTGTVRIGISGWRYVPWRGVFYPDGLTQRRELAYAAERLSSIEINGSFYSLQRPTSWRAWAGEVPEDFVFAVKGPRFVTHMKKLLDPQAPLANFFASGVLSLGARLGPLLWQLPPQLGYDERRLEAFFEQLPRTSGEASALAQAHHQPERLKGHVDTSAPVDVPLRHVLEVRHPSYRRPEFADLLRRHDVGLVVADSAGTWPVFDEVTSGVVYVRLHGDAELYASGYTDHALDRWAARVRGWADAGPDVYVYFDNDIKVHAPYDAIALRRRLGV